MAKTIKEKLLELLRLKEIEFPTQGTIRTPPKVRDGACPRCEGYGFLRPKNAPKAARILDCPKCNRGVVKIEIDETVELVNIAAYVVIINDGKYTIAPCTRLFKIDEIQGGVWYSAFTPNQPINDSSGEPEHV